MARAWVDVTGTLLDDERSENMAAEYMLTPAFRSTLADARSSMKRPYQARLEEHIEQLALIRDAALGAEKYSAAVSAEIARGKVQRFYDPPKDDSDPLKDGDLKKLGDEDLRKKASEIIARRKLSAESVSMPSVEGAFSGRPTDE